MMDATTDLLPFATMRQAMVTSQLRTTAVNDTRVVKAMAEVPREDFVPMERRDLAYAERTVPLGRGRELNVPMATGRLLTEAYLRRSDRVLLIGAATGYTAALLARLVAEVVAVEVDPDLTAIARTALANEASVTVVQGPLELGYPAGAPYDVIIIDGAVERVPDALVAQAKVGGRVLSGIVDNGVFRLAGGVRSEHGFGMTDFADALSAELPGFSRPRGFRF